MDIKLLNGRCLHGTIVAPYSYYLSLFSTSDKSEKQEQFMISMIDLVINNSVCNTLSFLCLLISPVKTNVLAQKLQVKIVKLVGPISHCSLNHMWVNTTHHSSHMKRIYQYISCQVGRIDWYFKPISAIYEGWSFVSKFQTKVINLEKPSNKSRAILLMATLSVPLFSVYWN